MSSYYDNAIDYNRSSYVSSRAKVLQRSGQKIKIGVGSFDKFIIILFVIISIMLLATLVSKFVMATQLSYQKQEIIAQTSLVVENNRAIEIDIARLSSSERIYDIAVNELGMVPAEAQNIKVVSKVVVSGIDNAGVDKNGSFKN